MDSVPQPTGDNSHARLWEVANASHTWMDHFAKLVQAYFDEPNEDAEMELRMEAVAIINATEAWRSSWA